MSEKPLVIQSEHLSDEARRWLAERCRLAVTPFDTPQFHSVIDEAEALVVRTYTQVDESLLALAPRLRVVGRAGGGLDNINVAACRARDIQVVYTPQANTQAVVEYVLLLICDALRPRLTVRESVHLDKWMDMRAQTVGRRQFSELTLGILGLGRIGKRIAQVAKAIGSSVLYNDLIGIPPELRFGAESVDVGTLFGRSDILSIHIDSRASNRGFIDKQLISQMKQDILFINTSRGFVVDNVALAGFLNSHPNARAMLDVHDPEPFDESYPLLDLPNATLYPHLASRTEAAMLNMSWVVKDVWAVLDGRKPKWPAPSSS